MVHLPYLFTWCTVTLISNSLSYTRFYKFNCVADINLRALFNKSLSSICKEIHFIAEWGNTKQLQSIPALPPTTFPESLWHPSLSFQLARFEHPKQRWILCIQNCTLFFVHVSPRKLYHILQRRKSVRELLVFFFFFLWRLIRRSWTRAALCLYT